MNDQQKLARMLRCISILGTQWGSTKKQLADKLEVTERTVYRYLETIQACGFVLDEDQNKRVRIHQPPSAQFRPEFSTEEVAHIRQLAGISKSPIMDSILTKVYEKSELPPVKELVYKARLLHIIDSIKLAIQTKKQLLIKNYHSANSSQINDRIVDPLEIQANFSMLLAFEPVVQESKLFKLDRMAGVELLSTSFKISDKHKKLERDIFGMSGDQQLLVTMQLSMRAHQLLREEYPAAIDYLIIENETFWFHGPVRAWEGIGRFVLGLPGEISAIQPGEFVQYLIQRKNNFNPK